MRPMPGLKKAPDSVLLSRIKLSDAPKVLKKLTGTSRGRTTIYNWMRTGLISYGGELVYLRYEVVLGRLYTTKAWIKQFIEEIEK